MVVACRNSASVGRFALRLAAWVSSAVYEGVADGLKFGLSNQRRRRAVCVPGDTYLQAAIEPREAHALSSEQD